MYAGFGCITLGSALATQKTDCWDMAVVIDCYNSECDKVSLLLTTLFFVVGGTYMLREFHHGVCYVEGMASREGRMGG